MPLTTLVLSPDGVPALAGAPGVIPVFHSLPGQGGLPDRLPDEVLEAEAVVVGEEPTEQVVELVGRLPRLRLFQSLFAGTDRFDGLLPAGLTVSNARGAHGAATAELAAGLLIAVYRELPGFVLAQAERRWTRRVTESLEGKRVLVVGAGDLATELQRRLHPFGVTVTLTGTRARPGVHGPEELPALLGGHDAVVLMVPMTGATRHLADAGFLARMPDGAVLVNVARGPVVDTDALLAELRAGRLRAALDVTDPEPLPPEHPLWTAPGVLIVPHQGGNTAGFMTRAWAVVADRLAEFAAEAR